MTLEDIKKSIRVDKNGEYVFNFSVAEFDWLIDEIKRLELEVLRERAKRARMCGRNE